MNIERFWGIVDTARGIAGSDTEGRVDALRNRMRGLSMGMTRWAAPLLSLLLAVCTASAAAAPTDFDVRGVEFRNLVAKLCLPKREHAVPVIVAFGGSEGGMSTGEAYCEMFAPAGIAVIALAYFKEEGLPSTLDQIPLEYFVSAIDYIQTESALDAGSIGVVSGSRGSEAALLLASIDSRIRSVAVTTPSNVSWGGMTSNKSAWTLHGKEVPWLAVGRDERIPRLQRFQMVLADKESVKAAIIHVEKINGPLLLVSAKNDEVWPSRQMSLAIEEYLAASSFKHSVTHATYLAGHAFSSATAPEIKQLIVDHFIRTLNSVQGAKP